MTLNFHKKPQRDFVFPFFFKFLLFLIYFFFFALYFCFQHADVHATACWRIGSYAPGYHKILWIYWHKQDKEGNRDEIIFFFVENKFANRKLKWGNQFRATHSCKPFQSWHKNRQHASRAFLKDRNMYVTNHSEYCCVRTIFQSSRDVICFHFSYSPISPLWAPFRECNKTLFHILLFSFLHLIEVTGTLYTIY